MFGSGGNGQGEFLTLCCCTLDNEGRILISDNGTIIKKVLLLIIPGNHRVQIFTAKGEWVSSFGRQGANAGEFRYPVGIAVDANSNIIVAERGIDSNVVTRV